MPNISKYIQIYHNVSIHSTHLCQKLRYATDIKRTTKHPRNEFLKLYDSRRPVFLRRPQVILVPQTCSSLQARDARNWCLRTSGPNGTPHRIHRFYVAWWFFTFRLRNVVLNSKDHLFVSWNVFVLCVFQPPGEIICQIDAHVCDWHDWPPRIEARFCWKSVFPPKKTCTQLPLCLPPAPPH